MSNTRKPGADRRAEDSGTQRSSRRSRPAELQPQATGANRGSPAASVMKQFAKTRAESSGRKS